ncbi:YihY/virulence factor BrkB family protein, partial [Stenotrophomonas geniculata]|uniref:YihY/virulence factor BrkB family protein n=2 Tax=Bacteria TaxID=2 RepID=UPI003137BAF9
IWAIGTIAFAWYVSNMGNYGKTYGPMATPIILLLWLWITNLAMLFGAEFDSETLRTRQLKTGYPAEELILLPVRDEKGIDKKAEKYDALVEQAHTLRLSSGVPDEAVRTMLPEAPKERSDERTMAAQAGSSEKRPTRPQSKTQE